MYKYSWMVILLLILAACGNQTDMTPRAIDEEVDVCELCYMSVSDKPFAAQFITNDGEVLKFDDIGCMGDFLRDYEEEGKAFLRDFYTNEWIEVENTFLSHSTEIETPMNSGFIAVGSAENQEKFLNEYRGEEISWTDILEKAKGHGHHE